MSRLLVTVQTHNDDLRRGSWADFIIKLRGIPAPQEFARFTGTDGLSNNSTHCFPIDVPALANPDQVEFFEIRHVTQEDWDQHADNWDASVQVDLLSPNALGSGGPHRFKGDDRTLRIFTSRKVARTIALQAANSQFVAAEGGGGRELVANRPHIGAWETFGLIELGSNRIALRADNGQHVAAEGGGGRELIANRPHIRAWETFTLVEV